MFSGAEKEIIGKFYEALSECENEKLELIWERGKVIAVFDTCFEDFDEEDESDEFVSFVFKGETFEGFIPIEQGEDNYFIINYHNFPSRIMLNGKKIN